MRHILTFCIRVVLPGLLLSYPLASSAVTWPVVTSVSVVNCEKGFQGPCSIYGLEGTAALLQIGSPVIDRPRATAARFYGIHCDAGDIKTGFSGCRWDTNSHGPSATCKFATPEGVGWELTAACSIPASWQWGLHSGANVGGECSVFGVGPSAGTVTSVTTPSGILDALTVANRGSRDCVKATEPSIPCHIGPLGELDHGEQATSTESTVSVHATVECGPEPSIDFVGGPVVELGSGVRTHLSAIMSSPGTLRVESRMTATNAGPGRYSTTRILVISPN